MPQPSDAWANQILDAAIAASGTLTVGLSSTLPSLSGGVYTNITDVTDVDNDRVTVTTWDAATDRYVIPADDLDFGDATDDFVWVAWVLYEDDIAVIAGPMAEAPLVRAGTHVVLPRQSMPIPMPAVGVT